MATPPRWDPRSWPARAGGRWAAGRAPPRVVRLSRLPIPDPIARRPVMDGLMMDWPLVLTHFLDRARRLHHRRVIASPHAGGVHRYTFGRHARRVARRPAALTALGGRRGDRVGTFGWNAWRHFEAYFAVPCMGAVLHTINVRLFDDQLVWLINHAGDRVVRS